MLFLLTLIILRPLRQKTQNLLSRTLITIAIIIKKCALVNLRVNLARQSDAMKENCKLQSFMLPWCCYNQKRIRLTGFYADRRSICEISSENLITI